MIALRTRAYLLKDPAFEIAVIGRRGTKLRMMLTEFSAGKHPQGDGSGHRGKFCHQITDCYICG